MAKNLSLRLHSLRVSFIASHLVLMNPCFADTPPPKIDNLSIIGTTEDTAVITINDKTYYLRENEQTPEGFKLTKIEETQLELEFEQHRSTYPFGFSSRLNAPATVPVAAPPVQKQEISIVPDAQGSYFVRGYIGNNSVRFLVDTGATSVAMNSQHAAQLGINYRQQGTKRLVSTASDVVTAYSVTIPQLRVGEIPIYAVNAFVIEGKQPDTILLGMNVLRQLEMEHQGSLLVLKQR